MNLGNQPYAKKGMLSTINKIYDPLGLASPFLLRGQKNLMQKKFTWDEQVSAETIEEWEQWKNDLKLLENINFNRCFKSPKFWRLIDCSLHHFSGASQDGYGQVSYLRLVDEDGHINCSLVIGKSRVTPLKFVSVPRLEFPAAALSVKVFLLLKKELTMWKTIREFYWTASMVTLGYIRNEEKRLKAFVANTAQLIRENSNMNQWRYIKTKKNRADYTSHGLTPSYLKKVKSWISGPVFLWKEESK